MTPPNELTHYGVLGMKWGVRKSKPKRSRKKKPKASTMTTKDLQKSVNRKRLERDYDQMTNKKKHRAKLIGAAALTAIATTAVSTIVRRYTGKGLDAVEIAKKAKDIAPEFIWDLPVSELTRAGF